MNKAVLLGHIVREPELKQTPNGISVLTFSLAVNRRFKNKQTGEYEADFINCVAWRQTAEFIAGYFHKGSSILVVGSIQTRKYETQTGEKRTATEVVVDEAYFTGEKHENQSLYGQGYSQSPNTQKPPKTANTVQKSGFDDDDFETIDFNDDKLPF